MDAKKITVDRLKGWKKKLAESNATPIALVGVGHEQHRGKLVLCICEDGLTDAEIATMLRGVANQLSAGGN